MAIIPSIPDTVSYWDRINGWGFNEGSQVFERDTLRRYEYNSNPNIIYKSQDTGVRRGFHEHQDASQAWIQSEDFAKTQPDLMYLLDSTNFNDFNGFSTLTNSGEVISRTTGVGSLNGYVVAQFNQSNVLYRENLNTLRSKSFLIGGWFRTDSLDETNILYQYSATNGNGIFVRFDENNNLVVRVRGTIEVSATIPALHLRDQQWHYIGVLVDRTTEKMTVLVSNGTLESAVIKEVPWSGNLTAMDNSTLTIGGFTTGTEHSGSHLGDASNFAIYTWENDIDYNTIAMTLAGIRDNPNKGVTITDSIQTSKRLNNNINLSGDVGSYVYFMVNLDEGVYDMLFTQHYDNNFGSYKLFIDNIDYGIYDTHDVPFPNFEAFVDGIALGKGWHFIKLEIVTPLNGDGSGGINLSQIKFNKIDGTNEGGASEFLILGDELRDRSEDITLGNSYGHPYNSGITSTTTVNDGKRLSGYVFLAEGMWEIILDATKANNYGIISLEINDQKIIDFDTYSATTVPTFKTNVFTRLAQGKNKITITVDSKNNSSTGFDFLLHSIRGVLKSGSSFGDNVDILAGDNDSQIISGDTNYTSGFLYALYSQERRSNGNERYYRWFSGGLYKATYKIRRYANAGRQIVDVGETIVYNQLDFTTGGTTETRLVYIPRGYHWVSIVNLSGANYWSRLNFKLLTRDGSTSNELPDRLAGKYFEGRTEQTARLNFGGILSDRLRITIKGRSSGSTINMRINDYTTNYKINSTRIVDGITTNTASVSNSLKVLESIDGSFTSVIDMYIGDRSGDLRRVAFGTTRTTNGNNGESIDWVLSGNDVQELKSLDFTSSNNWDNVTSIEVEEL